MTGETADSPKALNCRFDDHYVPAKRAHAAENANVRELAAFDAEFLGRLAPGGEPSALKGMLLRFGLSLAPKTGELEYDDVKKLILLRDAILQL